ncbi:DUF4352 domain-containing protein [Longispora albida]|uniref:DUF4352 domain-containing protein n=1 Tax=Longispora albida TaxID=203523 RepID=UPI0003681C2F|nr:DUF4352 domain-containing protein [Longispora albida]
MADGTKTFGGRTPLYAVLLLIGFVALIGGLVWAFGGSGGGSGSANKTPQAQPSGSPSLTGPPSDGGFEFTPGEVSCGVARVGDDKLNKAPQGQYCLVTVKVKNVTAQPLVFSDSLQQAVTAAGAEIRSDPVAGVYANGQNQGLVRDIPAGAEVTGIVVFDIPKETKIAKLELHGALNSKGVTVPVG